MYAIRSYYAIGVCRYFADDIPKADNVRRKVYVPLKWSSANSELNVPPEEPVPLNNFDYFPVSNGGADADSYNFV